MKSNIIKYGAVALFLIAGMAVPQASAEVVVSANVVVNGGPLFDALGIPIWGYGSRGRAIYAYSPEGLPVYAYNRVYSGCYVPDWDFRPEYRGPRWPRGIHKKGRDFRPAPHHSKKRGPERKPHGGDRPPHREPGHGPDGPGGHGKHGGPGGPGGGPRR